MGRDPNPISVVRRHHLHLLEEDEGAVSITRTSPARLAPFTRVHTLAFTIGAVKPIFS
jgi:hypothetical protein